MTDIVVDGTVRVTFAATIANPAAPTVAELNAGLLLQTLLTADGLIGFQPSTAEVDNSSLASTFSTKTIGRSEFSGTMLRLKRQTPLGSDTAWSTLTRGTVGFIVIRRWVTEGTAWASTQLCSVYPVICGETSDVDVEANSVARYEIPTPITNSAFIRATVA